MQVSKWGNSLAIRLPKKLVDEMKLAAGDEVSLTQKAARALMIEKIQRRANAIENMKARKWPLPDGYRFNRDEANER